MTTKYIYRIFCKNPEIKQCYIGSTNNLSQRMALHKSHAKDKSTQSSKFIRDNGGWENFTFEILNTIFVIPELKYHALQLENYYIHKYSNNINIRQSYISYYEYLDKKNQRYKNDEQFRERVKKVSLERYNKKC